MQEYFSNKTIEKLKYDLVREKLLNFEDLTAAEELSKLNNLHLGQVLVRENLLSEETLLKFIENNLHIPYINLEDYSLDEQCLCFISAEDAKKYKIIPLFRIEDVLTIAMADPLDLFVLNNLVKSVNCQIEPVISSERLILESVNKFYFFRDFKENEVEVNKKFDWRDELNTGIINEFQAEKVINAIIFQALLEEVYEIILENTGEGKFIKFKKENQFYEKGAIPLLLTPLFNSKLKSIAGLDPSAHEVPQLGKFNFYLAAAGVKQTEEGLIRSGRLQAKSSDAAGECITSIIATFPSVKGERITIKLYRHPETVNELSLKENDRIFLEENIKKSGIILVSGPGLSGKSFIAYSILNSLDKINKNIMTVESIAKYDLEGITQCELKEKVGFNFEKAAKFIDFQSPDVIYVEEVVCANDIKYLSLFANAQKTIITEILAENIEMLFNKLEKQEFNEFRKNVNCLIFVENKDKIQVIKSIEKNLTVI
ncbi:MAG: ATPase, T2SS/T4P/T4SS family [bacterium]